MFLTEMSGGDGSQVNVRIQWYKRFEQLRPCVMMLFCCRPPPSSSYKPLIQGASMPLSDEENASVYFVSQTVWVVFSCWKYWLHSVHSVFGQFSTGRNKHTWLKNLRYCTSTAAVTEFKGGFSWNCLAQKYYTGFEIKVLSLHSIEDAFWFLSTLFSSTHPSFLHTLSDHHYVVDVLLPNHLPEIIFGSWQRTLCGDVLPAEVITLKIHSVNMVVNAHPLPKSPVDITPFKSRARPSHALPKTFPWTSSVYCSFITRHMMWF